MDNVAAPEGIEVRILAAGRGVDWIGEGFALFKQAPGPWLGILAVWVLISIGLTAIGAELVGTFLNPVFNAGMMLGCVSLVGGKGLQVGHLFAAFKGDRLGALLMMVVIEIGLVLAVVAVVALVVLATVGGSVPSDLDQVNPIAMVLLGLLLLALILPLAMLTWFGPALIVLRRLPAWEAMKLSLRGCIANWLPLLVYGLVALVVLLVAALPLLLGLLVAIPVLAASIYTSYRDIYPEPAAPDETIAG